MDTKKPNEIMDIETKSAQISSYIDLILGGICTGCTTITATAAWHDKSAAEIAWALYCAVAATYCFYNANKYWKKYKFLKKQNTK